MSMYCTGGDESEHRQQARTLPMTDTNVSTHPTKLVFQLSTSRNLLFIGSLFSGFKMMITRRRAKLTSKIDLNVQYALI